MYIEAGHLPTAGHGFVIVTSLSATTISHSAPVGESLDLGYKKAYLWITRFHLLDSLDYSNRWMACTACAPVLYIKHYTFSNHIVLIFIICKEYLTDPH